MRHVRLTYFLRRRRKTGSAYVEWNESQVDYTKRVHDAITLPQINRINTALGRENDPMYLALFGIHVGVRDESAAPTKKSVAIDIETIEFVTLYLQPVGNHVRVFLFSGLLLRNCLRTRAALQTEILALRHQLLVLQRSKRDRRLRLKSADRVLWVWISRLWSGWRSALLIVKPETVIA
jgi:hypothetical protein